MSVKAVILAAGKGTRMLPLTNRRPKPLVPVAGRPILEHIVGGLASAGIDEVCLVIGWMGEQIQDAFGDGTALGCELTYVWQEEYGGTGAALLLAEEFIGDDKFVLGWGDIIIPPENYRNMMAIFRHERPEAMLAVNRVDDPWEGAAVYVEDGYVDRIIEKPLKGTSTTNFNNAGLFVFGPDVLQILKDTEVSTRGELEVPSAIETLLERGRAIRAYEIDGYWSDVARPSSAIAISGQIIERMAHSGVILHPEARVAPRAELRPPVLIGSGASVGNAQIGPNAVVMADARIGDGATLTDTIVLPHGEVGEACELARVVVEEGAAVPAKSSVQGSDGGAATIGGE
ncbi:MAG: NTP transferase domain-containing protein [Armatimonadia bacterium]|nr:NTP transferase domain-containing protein [Armatimonadia bacterium]